MIGSVGQPGDHGVEKGLVVDTWLIVLIVVAVVIVLALVALMMAKRRRISGLKKREQARDHLQESQMRAARADREQALAEEQAARARREKAEVEERAAMAEREARERAGKAHEERSAAEELRAKAEKLAPGLADGHDGQQRAGEPVRRDEPGGGATRR
jgi:biopolymer transport protein ExbB/TolQ